MMITKQQIAQQVTHVQQNGWMPWFRKAARKHSIPIPVLLAVASRETGMGTDPQWIANNFVGSDGDSTGIMQISRRFNPKFVNNTPPGRHDLFIDKGAELLNIELDRFNGNMKYALVAYNAGPDDVRQALVRGQDPDNRTTGGDYARDVIRRADIIKNELQERGILSASFTTAGITGLAVAIPIIFNKQIRQWLNF